MNWSVYMSAYEYILGHVETCTDEMYSDNHKQCYTCMRVGSDVLFLTREDKICSVCSWLSTQNEKEFGLLTGSRAHSPISFIGSLMIVEKQLITLVVTSGYQEKIPKKSCVKFLVYEIDSYIIKLLYNPIEAVIFKPSLRLEEYAGNLMVSDSKLLSITTSKGVYHLPIHIWSELNVLAKLNTNTAMQRALQIILDVSLGKVHDQSVRAFIADNYLLMTNLSELLNINVHAKSYMIKLFLKVLNGKA